MKIYTKTGDNGESGYIGGRLPKDHLLFEVVGTLDELNSILGIVQTQIKNEKLEIKNQFGIETIQSLIFSIGAIIAGGKSKVDFKEVTLNLEKDIDLMESSLEPLKNFILPGGSKIAAYIHHSRSICRRTERLMIKFKNSTDFNSLIDLKTYSLTKGKYAEIVKFINRLSDWMFVLARFINKKSAISETIWIGN